MKQTKIKITDTNDLSAMDWIRDKIKVDFH
jgi:hypothetical protein